MYNDELIAIIVLQEMYYNALNLMNVSKKNILQLIHCNEFKVINIL